MKFTLPLNNFSQGEWGPKLRARSDTEEYLKACEEITNFIPQVQGGAQFRAGLERVEIADVGQAALDTLGLSLSGLKAFYYTHSALPSQKYIVVPTATTFYIYSVSDTTATATSVSVLNLSSVGYTAEPRVASAGTNPTFSQFGDYVICLGVSTQPLIFYFDFSFGGSSFNAMTLMTFRYITPGLSRDFWTAYPWTQPIIQSSGPSLTLSSTTVGTGRTLTASSALFVANLLPANLIWPGVWFRFCDGTNPEGIAIVTGWTSTTVVTVTVVQAAPSAIAYGSAVSPTSFWQCQAWNPYHGFPTGVTGYQGRAVYVGGNFSPDSITCSRAGNIFDMQEIPEPNTTGVYGYADDAYISDNTRPFTASPSFDLGAARTVTAAKTILINCAKGEVVAFGTDGAIGPLNIQFEASTSFGSHTTQPIRANNFVTFVSRNARSLRDIVFNFEQGEYKSARLSATAEHFFESTLESSGYETIEQLACVEGTNTILYVRTNQGRVFGLVLDRDFGVTAWFRLAVSGSTTPPASPYQDSPEVQNIVAASNASELYLFVRRGSNTFLCRMTEPFSFTNVFNDPGSLTVKPVFLDIAQPATAAAAVPTTAWHARTPTYTNRYSGETVSVVADGSYIGEVSVAADANGTITLPVAASHVLIGYRYEGIIKTMPLIAGGQWGQPIGRHKRVDEASISFYNSLGCKYGRYETDLSEIPFRLNSQPMNEAPDYFTGDKQLTFPPGYERDFQVMVKQDKPYPCYIRSVTLRGQTFD